jgi:acyl-CoA synthetase (AMP-forming)/AMP-acid ligase II
LLRPGQRLASDRIRIVRRIGVVCAPHLCDQWEQELREKFSIESAVIQPSRIGRLERELPRGDIGIYQYYRHLVVSIDFVKSDRNRRPFLDNAPDLIIVDGRNHYPQDIEVTAQEAHPAIRPDHVAAFALPGEETERLVVVAERNRRVPLGRLDLHEVESAVRGAINIEHEMSVHEFVLIEPGGVSRTSSGKIARAATRQRYLDGELPTTEARLASRK